jgi:cytochrome c-type biogenesis protein CcmH
MILTFVLIAGTLAAGAALLLLLPLLRRRADARPAAAVAAVSILLVTLLGGAGLYAAFSNYTWTDAASGSDSPAAMTARLAKRLAKQSGTTEEWLTLGRSYVVLEQFPLALRAFQSANQVAGGKNAEAILNMAEVLVQLDVEELRGRAGRMFEEALVLEPTSRRALFYSAFAALGRGEPGLASERFNRMLANESDPQVRALLQKGLESAAQQQAGQTAGGAATPAAGKSDSPAGDAARIAVHVTLAPALAARVPADAALFVAARDPKSPGPPFAVKRLPARFPVDVELTPADAMLETRRITTGQQLDVVARVALGGTPTASSGDPFGQVSYHVGKDGKLNIVIDRLAP